MKFGLEENIIEKITRVLEEQPKVDKAYIFGSRAKGNYRLDSDIDIAVKGYDLSVEDILKMSAAIDKSEIGYEVDLVDYCNIKENALRDHVDRMGMELYSKWNTYTLGSLCSNIAYGYTASASDIPMGPKFLRITDIVPYQVNWETVPYCEINDKDHAKYKLNKGDIVIARTGATTGYNYLFNEDVDAVFASYLIRYRVDKSKADPFFIGHVLKTEYWKGFVEGIIGGSAQPGANAQMFASFEIKLPPLEEQTSIAESLSVLDKTIDLLHCQNKTLESMAETLFRQWFVNEIDNKWEVVTLSDLAYFFNGKSRPQEDGDIPVYGGNGILGYANTFNFFGKSIIIGRVGAYCGSLYYENRKIWVSDNALLLKAKAETTTHYLFYLLKTLDLNLMAEGSSHPLLTQTLLKGIEIAMPPTSKIEKFYIHLEQFIKKIESNNNSMHILINLRDNLLPKLLSGEARVKMS